MIVVRKTIKDIVFEKAKRYKMIDVKKEAGELDAIAAFVERASEDMIDGMLDMLDDGLIIGERRRDEEE
jgi:hypothetical protein